MNLYVGNLPFSTTAEELEHFFSQFGDVARTSIVIDRVTNRSRGFGFVEMTTGGEEAIERTNGGDYQGRKLTVNHARARETRPRVGSQFAAGRA
jgi:RNA recognition motif-containing protein